MDLLNRPRGFRVQTPFIAALSFLVGAPPAWAQDRVEYQVKGAYLFKFGDYVEWPENALPKPGKPFVIGILGEDPFGPSLDQILKRKSIQGRPIQIKRYKQVEDVWDVQVLFLGRADPAQQAYFSRSLEGLSILTVCDGETYSGAVLKFTTQDNKVRFTADVKEAGLRQLKLSSKLLSLAINRVPDSPPREK